MFGPSCVDGWSVGEKSPAGMQNDCALHAKYLPAAATLPVELVLDHAMVAYRPNASADETIKPYPRPHQTASTRVDHQLNAR